MEPRKTLHDAERQVGGRPELAVLVRGSRSGWALEQPPEDPVSAVTTRCIFLCSPGCDKRRLCSRMRPARALREGPKLIAPARPRSIPIRRLIRALPSRKTQREIGVKRHSKTCGIGTLHLRQAADRLRKRSRSRDIPTARHLDIQGRRSFRAGGTEESGN
jgi:hypothetical protein